MLGLKFTLMLCMPSHSLQLVQCSACFRIVGVTKGRIVGVTKGRIMGVTKGRIVGVTKGRVVGVTKGRHNIT